MEAMESQISSIQAPTAIDWQAEYFRVIPKLKHLAGRILKPGDVVILRASQLDAGRLDTELTSLLHEQFLKVFSLAEPRYVNALKPEFSLLINFLIFRLSVWVGKPTPGCALLNLRFRDEKAYKKTNSQVGGRTGVEGPGLSTPQKLSWGLGNVAVRYVWERLESIASAYHWMDHPVGSTTRKCWQLIQWAETGFRLASLVNFFIFLRHGVYRNLVERFIESRLVYQRSNAPRVLNFEYLNQQLVWHELSDLMLFLLPLISVPRISNMFANVPGLYRTSRPGGSPNRQVMKHWCNICRREDMALPYEALPCHHLFCYYCLRSETEAQPGYKCPTCGMMVRAMRRWRTRLEER